MPTEDKYTIAWFKLAEFVSRGEKERALGIYKLLILSIDDPAFALKLEADILYSFRDELAFEKYHKSAILYQKENRLIEAAAIFENLHFCKPDSIEYLNSLINLYTKLNYTFKIIFHLKNLFLLKIKNSELHNSIDILEKIEKLTNENLGEYFEQLSLLLIQDKKIDQELSLNYIQKTIDAYFFYNDRTSLQRFVTKIEALNPTLYKKINIKKF